MRNFRRIFVPVDGSPTSNKALVAALNIARDGNGRVRMLHVVDPYAYMTGFEASATLLDAINQSARRVLADAVEVAKAAGVEADTKLVDVPGERLGDIVAREAVTWEADLIVVGTHGRKGVQRMFLGSGAEQIIRLALLPVLVIRGEA
jgi:nucleotide-binding universal stress UspA family protein